MSKKIIKILCDIDSCLSKEQKIENLFIELYTLYKNSIFTVNIDYQIIVKKDVDVINPLIKKLYSISSVSTYNGCKNKCKDDKYKILTNNFHDDWQTLMCLSHYFNNYFTKSERELFIDIVIYQKSNEYIYKKYNIKRAMYYRKLKKLRQKVIEVFKLDYNSI